jgi:hypothetical protein
MTSWRNLRILAGVLLAASLTIPASVPAAEDVDAEFEAGNWGTELKLGVNLLQSYYTENWNGGDKGSIVWTATLDALAKKQLSEAFSLTNTLNLAFGQNHQQERDQAGQLYWQRPDKTTDEITFESLLRYTKSKFNPYASVRFESQFLDQNDPRKEFTLNPLKFSESVGISRTLVKNDEREWLVRLGFALNQSIRDLYIFDDTASPVIDMIETESTNNGGIELIFDYKSSYFDDEVDYVGQLRFFQPVFDSNKSDIEDLDPSALTSIGLDEDLADYTTQFDIDFKNTFTTNITKALNVELTVHWIYDKYDSTVPVLVDDGGTIENPEAVAAAVRKKGQLKQTMSIGLAHTF